MAVASCITVKSGANFRLGSFGEVYGIGCHSMSALLLKSEAVAARRRMPRWVDSRPILLKRTSLERRDAGGSRRFRRRLAITKLRDRVRVKLACVPLDRAHERFAWALLAIISDNPLIARDITKIEHVDIL